jgi:glyoxylase-like metal-dependent hydrolase (beta-lactamase superfamily II)
MLRLFAGFMVFLVLLGGCASGSVDGAGDESAGGRASAEIGPELSGREIAEGVWLIRHDFGWSGNSLVVEMADGSVVFLDAPYLPDATAALVEWVEGRFEPSRMVAINNHYHFDATGGNRVFLDRGIPVYGSDRLARAHAERIEDLRGRVTSAFASAGEIRRRFAEADFAGPDRTFAAEEGLTLRFGGEDLEVFFPGAAHTPGNTVTWLPARGILFGGCMVRAGDSIGPLADADLGNYAEAARRLRRFDAAMVVPGHGEPGGMELIENTIRLAEEAREPDGAAGAYR